MFILNGERHSSVTKQGSGDLENASIRLESFGLEVFFDFPGVDALDLERPDVDADGRFADSGEFFAECEIVALDEADYCVDLSSLRPELSVHGKLVVSGSSDCKRRGSRAECHGVLKEEDGIYMY